MNNTDEVIPMLLQKKIIVLKTSKIIILAKVISSLQNVVSGIRQQKVDNACHAPWIPLVIDVLNFVFLVQNMKVKVFLVISFMYIIC